MERGKPTARRTQQGDQEPSANRCAVFAVFVKFCFINHIDCGGAQPSELHIEEAHQQQGDSSSCWPRVRCLPRIGRCAFATLHAARLSAMMFQP